MKWIISILSIIIIYSYFTGYTGGASKLGENYHKVMRTPK